MASVNFYVGAYYLFFYLKRPQIREHLPFALLCLSVACYDVFSAGLYNSRALADGVFWQRLQLDTAGAIAIFLIVGYAALNLVNEKVARKAALDYAAAD